jgi:uncharacterized protein
MADHGEIEAYRLLSRIIGFIVEDPDVVEVEIALGLHGTLFHITADKRNTALLLGRQGRTARSIRTIMTGMGMKAKWHYYVEVEGDLSDPNGPVD